MVNGHWLVNRTVQVAMVVVRSMLYSTTEPRYLWYCSTKKYRELHCTGTVKKWYRGSTVVPPNTTSYNGVQYKSSFLYLYLFTRC